MFSLLCRVAVGWVDRPIMLLPAASDDGVSSWVCVAVSVRGSGGDLRDRRVELVDQIGVDAEGLRRLDRDREERLHRGDVGGRVGDVPLGLVRVAPVCSLPSEPVVACDSRNCAAPRISG